MCRFKNSSWASQSVYLVCHVFAVLRYMKLFECVHVQVMSIQEYPVQAAICSPVDGSTVDVEDGAVTVHGYALSGGGRGIQRVDVTVDGGRTWHAANLQMDPQQYGHQWAWTIWDVTVPLPAMTTGQRVEIAAKATDTSNNTQPETDVGIWNMRGLLENKWHRVYVSIVTQSDQ